MGAAIGAAVAVAQFQEVTRLNATVGLIRRHAKPLGMSVGGCSRQPSIMSAHPWRGGGWIVPTQQDGIGQSTSPDRARIVRFLFHGYPILGSSRYCHAPTRG